MALFDNPSESNLRACAQMVEDVLVGRGLDLDKARLPTDGGLAWILRQGSANIVVSIIPGTPGQKGQGQHGNNTFKVVAPVIRADKAALASIALYRKLLELNATHVQQASFGMRGDDVILTADRSTAGLDPVEIEEMIRRVSAYADHFDDALVSEFGGKRSSDL